MDCGRSESLNVASPCPIICWYYLCTVFVAFSDHVFCDSCVSHYIIHKLLTFCIWHGPEPESLLHDSMIQCNELAALAETYRMALYGAYSTKTTNVEHSKHPGTDIRV